MGRKASYSLAGRFSGPSSPRHLSAMMSCARPACPSRSKPPCNPRLCVCRRTMHYSKPFWRLHRLTPCCTGRLLLADCLCRCGNSSTTIASVDDRTPVCADCSVAVQWRAHQVHLLLLGPDVCLHIRNSCITAAARRNRCPLRHSPSWTPSTCHTVQRAATHLPPMRPPRRQKQRTLSIFRTGSNLQTTFCLCAPALATAHRACETCRWGGTVRSCLCLVTPRKMELVVRGSRLPVGPRRPAADRRTRLGSLAAAWGDSRVVTSRSTPRLTSLVCYE